MDARIDLGQVTQISTVRRTVSIVEPDRFF